MEHAFHEVVQAKYSYLPQTRGFEDCGFEVSADDIENILNQRIAGKLLTLADCWRKQHVTKHIFRF